MLCPVAGSRDAANLPLGPSFHPPTRRLGQHRVVRPPPKHPISHRRPKLTLPQRRIPSSRPARRPRSRRLPPTRRSGRQSSAAKTQLPMDKGHVPSRRRKRGAPPRRTKTTSTERRRRLQRRHCTRRRLVAIHHAVPLRRTGSLKIHLRTCLNRSTVHLGRPSGTRRLPSTSWNVSLQAGN